MKAKRVLTAQEKTLLNNIFGEGWDDESKPLPKMKTEEELVNESIQRLKDRKYFDPNLVSDGYHTFGELYEHRAILYIALLRRLFGDMEYRVSIWKSKRHSDGSQWDGWFLLGTGTIKGTQITYHLPEKYWDDCDFASEVNEAPEFDGHTSDDVLERISKL